LEVIGGFCPFFNLLIGELDEHSVITDHNSVIGPFFFHFFKSTEMAQNVVVHDQHRDNGQYGSNLGNLAFLNERFLAIFALPLSVESVVIGYRASFVCLRST
jgi:hypothetical protein